MGLYEFRLDDSRFLSSSIRAIGIICDLLHPGDSRFKGMDQKGGNKVIATLLIGESFTGKTRSLETLPGGTVLFSFDKGGYQSLDSSFTPPIMAGGKVPRKRLKKLKFPSISEPSFMGWLKSNDKLEKDEILVIEYIEASLISLNQYTASSTKLFISFANDFNQLITQEALCKSKGIWHIALDSLSSFKDNIIKAILGFSNHVILSQPDWGLGIAKIKEVIDTARGTQFDFIMTCHIQAEKDEVTGRLKEIPLVFGKGLPKEILQRFDDVLVTRSEKGPSGMEYYWSPIPIDLLIGIGTRCFDDLPAKIPQNFMALYGERLNKKVI